MFKKPSWLLLLYRSSRRYIALRFMLNTSLFKAVVSSYSVFTCWYGSLLLLSWAAEPWISFWTIFSSKLCLDFLRPNWLQIYNCDLGNWFFKNAASKATRLASLDFFCLAESFFFLYNVFSSSSFSSFWSSTPSLFRQSTCQTLVICTIRHYHR